MVERIRAELEAAARQAKAERAAGLSLSQQTEYIILVAREQARRQHDYSGAQACHLAVLVLRASGSVQAAWASLQEVSDNESDARPEPPNCNTGVTPLTDSMIDYLSGGRT